MYWKKLTVASREFNSLGWPATTGFFMISPVSCNHLWYPSWSWGEFLCTEQFWCHLSHDSKTSWAPFPSLPWKCVNACWEWEDIKHTLHRDWSQSADGSTLATRSGGYTYNFGLRLYMYLAKVRLIIMKTAVMAAALSQAWALPLFICSFPSH